jgi:hypothetical protein
MIKWLLVFCFVFPVQAQQVLKPGLYRDLKADKPIVLDTGSYTFIGLEMKNLGKGIWLDACKARSITLYHCQFDGSNEGIALQSSGDVRVSNCTFTKLNTAILQEQIPGSIRKVIIYSNTFENNATAISLQSSTGTQYFTLNLKCNTFLHETTSGTERKGLVIGPNVAVGSRDPSALNNFAPDVIGGSQALLTGIRYPNANIWPTAQADRSVAPTDDQGEPVDIDDPTFGWQDAPNWTPIENLSGTTITYFKYENEFVKNKSTQLSNLLWTGPNVRAATHGYQTNPILTYEFPCDSDVDPWPVVVFPARIALVSSLENFDKQIENSWLGDPIPNPAREECKIHFSILEEIEQATLQIMEMGTGRVLQNINVKERGKGEIVLNLAKAPSGIYSYRFLVNGVASSAKKLIVVH